MTREEMLAQQGAYAGEEAARGQGQPGCLGYHARIQAVVVPALLCAACGGNVFEPVQAAPPCLAALGCVVVPSCPDPDPPAGFAPECWPTRQAPENEVVCPADVPVATVAACNGQ